MKIVIKIVAQGWAVLFVTGTWHRVMISGLRMILPIPPLTIYTPLEVRVELLVDRFLIGQMVIGAKHSVAADVTVAVCRERLGQTGKLGSLVKIQNVWK